MAPQDPDLEQLKSKLQKLGAEVKKYRGIIGDKSKTVVTLVNKIKEDAAVIERARHIAAQPRDTMNEIAGSIDANKAMLRAAVQNLTAMLDAHDSLTEPYKSDDFLDFLAVILKEHDALTDEKLIKDLLSDKSTAIETWEACSKVK